MDEQARQQVTPTSQSGGLGPLGWIALLFVGGIVCAWLGNVLSDNPEPPQPANSLHGSADPAAMNARIDRLLSESDASMLHDHSFVTRAGLAVGALCLACLVVTSIYVVRKRKAGVPVPSTLRTLLMIALLALPAIVITCYMSIEEESLLHSGAILQSLQNDNTWPKTVPRGTRVSVDIPVSMQSFFGYYEGESVTVDRAVALLSSGDRVSVTLDSPNIGSGGRKPGKTDLIPLMENVKPAVGLTVPDSPQIEGAVISFAAAGVLKTVPRGEREPVGRESFDSYTMFRVARDSEVKFRNDYEKLSGNLGRLHWLSWPTAGLVFIGIFFCTPSECKSCKKRINVVRLYDGHLCPQCFNAKKGDSKASEDKTASQNGK